MLTMDQVHTAVDVVAESPALLAIVLAILFSPHFEMIVRHIVKLTPTPVDDTWAAWGFSVLKALAGVIYPAPPAPPVDPDAPPAPPAPARRGLLRRLLG